MWRRGYLALLPVLLLTGCFGGGQDYQPPPKPRSASTLPNRWQTPDDRDTRACFADLRRMGVAFNPLPDQDFGTGCSISGAVQLVDIGVPVTGLKAMRCGEARAFAGWVRHAVAPAARQLLQGDLARVETYGTYACRNVVGNSAYASRRSGHAIANAVDVAGFVLDDGRRVTVLADWNSPNEDAREFLRVIRASACKRFGTVLSPDYNAAHRNHFHLEDDAANFCR